MLIIEQRRKARISALQFLFGLEFHPFEGREELDDFWKNYPARISIRKYAETLIFGIIENMEMIDELIKKSLIKWKWERVGLIEKVILRIAVYEGGIIKNLSPTSAISEAIELAKIFGEDESIPFINAVLEKVFIDEGWLIKNREI